MARIMVMTDDGEVLLSMLDEDDEIRDLTGEINRSRVMEDIADAVRTARQKDRRKPEGGE